MRRRHFLQTAILLPASAGLARPACAPVRPGPMDRIGMSTVLLRRRFEQTRPADEPADTPRLNLLDTPAYLAERFGVSNVEFWSRHFESIEPDYLDRLRNGIDAAGATLINIQCDERYQIGDADPEKRRASVDLVLAWVDAAARLGARAIRVNPGKGEYPLVMESYREISGAARRQGLRLLIENHFGLATDPAVHLDMVEELGTDNTFTLPDYGNYPDESRYADLLKVMPNAYQVSAKAADFNATGQHVSFDFDRCMEIAESSGFQGIYSVEQWSREPTVQTDEWLGDWLIEQVLARIS